MDVHDLKNIDKDEFFRQVTLKISSSLEIDEALSNLYEYLRQYIPMDEIGLHYFDESKMRIRAVSHIETNNPVLLKEKYPDGFPITDDIMEMIEDKVHGKQVTERMNRPGQHPKSILTMFPELASKSTLTLSLRIKDEFVGGMFISAPGTDRYDEYHEDLIAMVKEPIAIAMSNARRYQEVVRLKNLLAEDNKALERELESIVGSHVVGADFGLRNVMELVRQVSPTSSPVLLLGETGTGKEVIANAINGGSPRRDGPMIRVHCGAIPETLLDSELFGHEKGSFTGALTRKRGKFERAHKGTIFLDEIGELTLDAQVRLLRVLQEKEFERVGGTETIHIDVRVITATNRNLEQMVKEGRFREDLWFRLNVFPLRLPPLRQRKEDIPSLVQYFIERKARELNMGRIPPPAPGAMDRLVGYDWPGNVRELQNLVERALILSHGQPLEFPSLGATESEVPVPGAGTSEFTAITLDKMNEKYILRVLDHTNGKISGQGGAAELLGLNSSTLRSRMKKLGITNRRSSPWTT